MLLVNDRDCTLLLHVPPPKIPDYICDFATTHNIPIKPEFHISLLVSANAKKFAIAKTGSKVLDIANQYDWSYSTSPDYYLFEKHYTSQTLKDKQKPDTTEHLRLSIIQKVTMPDLKHFYQQLTLVCDDVLQIPVPHITLYTYSNCQTYMHNGIGIHSEKDFMRYSKAKITTQS